MIGLGMVQKIARLLRFDSTRILALKTLLVATRYRGPASSKIGENVARLNGTLSRILLHSDDNRVAELALATMTHANRLALWASYPLPRSTLDSFLIPNLLSNLLTFLRRSNPSYTVLSHAVDLIVTPAQHCPEAYTTIVSLVPLLASLTRASLALRPGAGALARNQSGN